MQFRSGMRACETQRMRRSSWPREKQALSSSKDRDFVSLLDRMGPPPQILWLTIGNTSNAHLKKVLSTSFGPAHDLLEEGEDLVEITDQKRAD